MLFFMIQKGQGSRTYRIDVKLKGAGKILLLEWVIIYVYIISRSKITVIYRLQRKTEQDMSDSILQASFIKFLLHMFFTY